MFGRETDPRVAGAKGGSKRTPAQVATLAKARAARKPIAVVVESASGTDVLVVHDWKKHCKNCAQAQN